MYGVLWYAKRQRHLSRKLQLLGHDARLMPAKYVRPHSKVLALEIPRRCSPADEVIE